MQVMDPLPRQPTPNAVCFEGEAARAISDVVLNAVNEVYAEGQVANFRKLAKEAQRLSPEELEAKIANTDKLIRERTSLPGMLDSACNGNEGVAAWLGVVAVISGSGIVGGLAAGGVAASVAVAAPIVVAVAVLAGVATCLAGFDYVFSAGEGAEMDRSKLQQTQVENAVLKSERTARLHTRRPSP
jgi:hypothetical protein